MSEQQAAALLEQVVILNAKVAEIASVLEIELLKSSKRLAAVEIAVMSLANTLHRIGDEGLPMRVVS